MTGQQLRNSILQEAIHGRLVPNTLQPGEHTARELLDDILAARQKAENETKGKKAKKLTLSKIEEEPWELPEGWCWCRLQDVVHVDCPISYGIVQTENHVPNGIPVVRPVDMTKLHIGIEGLKRVAEDIAKSYIRTTLRGDEILMCVRGTTGVMSFATKELKGGNVTRGITPLFFPNEINKYFIYYALAAPLIQGFIVKKTKGAALKQINMVDLRAIPIPLPPLSIQHEIVSKIEEIFAVLDSF